MFFEKEWLCLYRRNNQTPWSSIKTTSRYWCADPFLVTEGDETYFFCEAMDRKKSKGIIAYGKIREDGDSQIENMIDFGCHSSYPCMFKYDRQWFMIPETIGRHSIEIYKADHFPGIWSKVKDLKVGFDAVDTTFFENSGKVFLFIYSPNKNKNRLSIAQLDMKECKIIQEKEVVIYDQKIGRPAGNIIIENNTFIRPTQYGVNFYGEKIVLKKFMFNPETLEYSESDCGEIDIQNIKNKFVNNYIGIHTYNRCNYEIVDICYEKFHLFRPLAKIAKLLHLFGYK